jgi:nucleoside-diphosphate-sugar epimerase
MTARWIAVTSASGYAAHDRPDADEAADLLPPAYDSTGEGDEYGPAKVAIERIVEEAVPDRWVALRAGLIAGPGDGSDRFGYWVGRFALAGDDAVLVPDSPSLVTQAIDVRDLASFALSCAQGTQTGAVNVVGVQIPISDLLDEAAGVAGHGGERIAVRPSWLQEHEVQPWAGERSLPMWLPLPEYAGFMTRSDRRAVQWGLSRRPVRETLADVLVDERARGLTRPRRAGLTREDETQLLRQWQATPDDELVAPDGP